MAKFKLLGGLILLGGFVGFILAATSDIIGLTDAVGKAPTVIDTFQMSFIVLGIVIAIIGGIIMMIPSKAAAPSAETDLATEELEAEEYECPSCGATVSADATSCSECGEVFEREEFECPSCGAIVDPDATSCPECGEEFEAEEEEVAVPPVVPTPAVAPVPEVAAAPPTPMEAPAQVPMEAPAEEAGGEEYECPSCGAVVGEDDSVCPNCGEEFE